MIKYRDNYPYNIEAPQKLYIEYAADINFDYSNGKQPNGEESAWIWEKNYIPVEHKVNGLTVGRHEWMKTKVGDRGIWSYPIRVSAAITNIETIRTNIEGSGSEFSFTIKLTLVNGTIITSDPIIMKDGIDGTKISTAIINGSGHLILSYDDGTVIDAGNAKGEDGTQLPTPLNDDYLLSQSGGVILWVDPSQVLGNIIQQQLPIEYDVLTGIISHNDDDGYKHIPVGGTNGQLLSTNGSGVYSWVTLGAASLDSVIVQDNVLYGNRTIEAAANTFGINKTTGSNIFSLDLNNSNISIKHLNTDTSNSAFVLDGSSTRMLYTNAVGNTQAISLFNVSGIQINDSIANLGLVYANDYSANYTLRSLVDKEYVDSSITSYSFSNGLIETGGVVKLGGNIIEETYIDLNNFNFGFHTIGASQPNLQINFANYQSSIRVYQSLEDSVISVTKDYITIDSTGSINFISGVGISVNYSNNGEGFKYSTDLSNTFVTRSLIDKGYSDNHLIGKTTSLINALNTNTGPGLTEDGYALVWDNVSNEYILAATGGSYIFTNGLTNTTGTVSLGGNLVEATIINLVDNDLTFLTGTGIDNVNFGLSGTGNQIGSFAAYANSTAIGYTDDNIEYTFTATSGNAEIYGSDGVNAYVDLYISLGSSYFESSNGANTSTINLFDNNININGDGVSVTFDNTGAYYDSDVSGSYTIRHLVDKGYVDSLISTPDIAAVLAATTYSGNVTHDGLATAIGELRLNKVNVSHVLETKFSPVSGYLYGGLKVTPSTVTLYTIDNQTGVDKTAYFSVNSGSNSLEMHRTDTLAGTAKYIAITGSGITILDTESSKGAEYAADYSANYTNRSLIDKEYVDNAVIANCENLHAEITATNNGLLSCANTSIDLLGSSNQASVTFQWDGSISGDLGTTNPLSVSSAETITLTVTNTVTGCVTQKEIVIGIDLDIPTVYLQKFALFGGWVTIGAFNIVPIAGHNYSYTWTTNANIETSLSAPFIRVSAADTYEVTITDLVSGCSAVSSIAVVAGDFTP